MPIKDKRGLPTILIPNLTRWLMRQPALSSKIGRTNSSNATKVLLIGLYLRVNRHASKRTKLTNKLTILIEKNKFYSNINPYVNQVHTIG